MSTPAKRLKRKAVNDNPLWLHQSGQWCKKIRGKHVYFGSDLKAALEQYEQEKAAWQAGLNPRTDQLTSDRATVGEVVNLYLAELDQRLQVREIAPRTFEEAKRTGARIIEQFGRHRAVADLKPADFAAWRGKLAQQYGPTRLGNEIVRIRTMLKWAYENEHIDNSVRFGTGFSKPSKKVLQRYRNSRPKRDLTAAELQKALNAADPQMQAMILLGVNCGFGAADIAILPQSALDLKRGWVEHERAKTAVMRRCPLWPETVKALRNALKARPDPKSPEDDHLVFVTRFGRPWLRVSAKGGKNDEIGKGFAKLLTNCGCKRPGVSFYVLRHILQTIGEETRDLPAVAALMGHTDQTMAAHYRIDMSDDRLRAVTDHVRAWLLLRVAKSSSHWAIMGHPNSYWTGDAWSTDIKSAVKFESEDEARSQIKEQRVALLASPFCRE